MQTFKSIPPEGKIHRSSCLRGRGEHLEKEGAAPNVAYLLWANRRKETMEWPTNAAYLWWLTGGIFIRTFSSVA